MPKLNVPSSLSPPSNPIWRDSLRKSSKNKYPVAFWKSYNNKNESLNRLYFDVNNETAGYPFNRNFSQLIDLFFIFKLLWYPSFEHILADVTLLKNSTFSSKSAYQEKRYKYLSDCPGDHVSRCTGFDTHRSTRDHWSGFRWTGWGYRGSGYVVQYSNFKLTNHKNILILFWNSVLKPMAKFKKM